MDSHHEIFKCADLKFTVSGQSIEIDTRDRLSSHSPMRLRHTSEMIHHHGVSLSKQQTADLLLCHGTQQDLIMLINS